MNAHDSLLILILGFVAMIAIVASVSDTDALAACEQNNSRAVCERALLP